MYIASLDGCCGVKELCEIGDVIRIYNCDRLVRDILGEIEDDYPDNSIERGVAAHLIFTSTGNYGQRFADYITAHELGTVVRSSEAENPNSGNFLIAWIWTPDWPALTMHVAKLSQQP